MNNPNAPRPRRGSGSTESRRRTSSPKTVKPYIFARLWSVDPDASLNHIATSETRSRWDPWASNVIMVKQGHRFSIGKAPSNGYSSVDNSLETFMGLSGFKQSLKAIDMNDIWPVRQKHWKTKSRESFLSNTEYYLTQNILLYGCEIGGDPCRFDVLRNGLINQANAFEHFRKKSISILPKYLGCQVDRKNQVTGFYFMDTPAKGMQDPEINPTHHGIYLHYRFEDAPVPLWKFPFDTERFIGYLVEGLKELHSAGYALNDTSCFIDTYIQLDGRPIVHDLRCCLPLGTPLGNRSCMASILETGVSAIANDDWSLKLLRLWIKEATDPSKRDVAIMDYRLWVRLKYCSGEFDVGGKVGPPPPTLQLSNWCQKELPLSCDFPVISDSGW